MQARRNSQMGWLGTCSFQRLFQNRLDGTRPQPTPYEVFAREIPPGTEKLYPADSVIIPAGQGPLDRLVNTTEGLEVSPRGLLVTDKDGHTTRPEVFACGGVASGARTVVEAVAAAKRVADSMDAYMRRAGA